MEKTGSVAKIPTIVEAKIARDKEEISKYIDDHLEELTKKEAGVIIANIMENLHTNNVDIIVEVLQEKRKLDEITVYQNTIPEVQEPGDVKHLKESVNIQAEMLEEIKKSNLLLEELLGVFKNKIKKNEDGKKEEEEETKPKK